ncbi:unnamed protein product, partial [Ectocarpus sp. 12 AP-2014]
LRRRHSLRTAAAPPPGSPLAQPAGMGTGRNRNTWAHPPLRRARLLLLLLLLLTPLPPAVSPLRPMVCSPARRRVRGLRALGCLQARRRGAVFVAARVSSSLRGLAS